MSDTIRATLDSILALSGACWSNVTWQKRMAAIHNLAYCALRDMDRRTPPDPDDVEDFLDRFTPEQP